MRKLWIAVLILLLALPLTNSYAQRCNSRVDYIQEASDAFDDGDVEALLDAAECAVDVDPENPEALQWLAQAYYSDSDYQGAIDVASQAIDIDDSNWYSYALRADAFAVLGDYEGGLQDAQTAVDLEPNAQYALVVLAEIELQIGNPDEAITLTDTIIDNNDANAFTYWVRGQAFHALGEPRDAAEAMEIALNENPDSLYYQRVAAELYTADENYDAALELLEQLTADGGYDTLYAMQSLASLGNGDEDGALDFMDEFLSTSADKADPLEDGLQLDISSSGASAVSFEAQAGDVVSLTVSNAERGLIVDPYIFLVGPDGLPLAFDDDRGLGRNAALLEIELPEDGEYTLYIGTTTSDEGLVEISFESN
jgi:tetratricopeptide (TPR) repeat protein